jgi:hypothetical protein
MDIETLLGKGYFPTELPPPFQTRLFAEKIDKIGTSLVTRLAVIGAMPSVPGSRTPLQLANKKLKESKWTRFSVPKFGFLRRSLAIPNPLHQAMLSKTICDNWADIQALYVKSLLGASKPVEKGNSDRAVERQYQYGKFLDDCILQSHSDKRNLWNERSIWEACNYVNNSEGDDLPDYDRW